MKSMVQLSSIAMLQEQGEKALHKIVENKLVGYAIQNNIYEEMILAI